MKAPDQAAHANELELLGSDVADVTIPIDPDAHQLTYHPAVAPTASSDGNIAYWTCDLCGKYFSDGNGEHEITQEETVIPSSAAFKIYVKTLSSETFTIYVASAVTIATVKEMLAAETGIPAERQKLIFAGKNLEDGRTIGDYNIQRESTLHLIPISYFPKHSLTLNGDIGVNFYLNLTDTELAQNVTVNFLLNGENHSTYTIDAGRDANTIDGETLYKASCFVCAPEMADTITAEVKVNGETVATEDYSVKTYGDTFLSDAYKATFLEKGHTLDEYNKLAALVQTMLNYGAYTQIQFSEENAGSNPNNNTTHDAENLANADINYDLTPLTENEINAIEMSAPNKEAMNAKLSGTGLTYYGYTMLLHSETKLRFYFIKDSKNTDITGIHLSRDGVTYDAQNYNAKYAFVEVPAIPAYELNYSYTLTVGEENLGSYSALTYVKDVLENSPDDTTLRNTVTAMYRYHMAAVEWFNNN